MSDVLDKPKHLPESLDPGARQKRPYAKRKKTIAIVRKHERQINKSRQPGDALIISLYKISPIDVADLVRELARRGITFSTRRGKM